MTDVAIFDRDGTIIDVVRDEETGAITVAFHPDQLRFLPGAVAGMRALEQAGFTIAIATNQPAPAKGQFSALAVTRTNDALVARLAAEGVRVAAVEVCLHHPEGGPGGDPALVRVCDCRKPKPGLIQRVLAQLAGDRSRSWMIGDGVGDVEAGRAAGVKTALVFATNRCELCPLRPVAPVIPIGSVAGAEAAARGERATGREMSSPPPAAGRPDVHGASLLDVARAIVGHA